MKKIPKIIHQIWGGSKKLPTHLEILSKTWKRDYPDWQYEFWDDERINKFVLNNYPEYYEQFMSFPYDIQRWDSVRYFILDKIGGMYIDFDYESIMSIEPLIGDKECCFALDPKTHYMPGRERKEHMLNNALMLSIPKHWVIKKIIKTVFSKEVKISNRENFLEQVYSLAGPWMLVDFYYNLNEDERKDIFLISEKFVSPFNRLQAKRFISGEMERDEIQARLKYAYAVHYFGGEWK